ncbi:MAG TPA: DUF885 domain-containing protein [Steroidobacter sp.]|nr:DUF885 domain-containing protein [Steroidobacter sp.]
MRVKLVFALLATGSMSCAALSKPASPDVSPELHLLFDEYFERSLQMNPVQATFIGDHRYDDRLTNDISPAFVREAVAVERRFLQAASEFEERDLTDADRLSLEIFVRERRTALAAAEFPSELLPVNQFQSLPARMPVLGSGVSAQPFATAQDYDRFLARMREYVVWSDQAIANMREGVRKGVLNPRVLMEKTLPQLASVISDTPENSVFWRPLTKFPDSMAAAERERIQSAYRNAITQEIDPAYRRLHDFIRDEYLKAARASVACSDLPDGRRWYAFLARYYTTTDLSPQAIHQMGLEEVARIRAEMERVKSQVGFKGDLAAFFKSIQEDQRFYYTDEAALLQGYRDLKSKIDERLPKLFSDFPKADYEVRPVEAFRAASAASGSYQKPSADGSRPGIFYVNTYNLKALPKFGMETLSLHEAAPGHHFQLAIQQELEDLPRFRRFGADYVAYVEGWALYAESLGPELGMFTDPYQYFGRLGHEMLRAMRLVVDTGLHTNHWTREQAIRYMLENSSMTTSAVTAEVERYIAVPGQALGYKVGQTRIRRLREKGEKALGPTFDVREFHSEVLRDGALPIDVLEKKIERWIQKKRLAQGG